MSHDYLDYNASTPIARFLVRLGARVTYLAVDRTGRANPGDVRKAITPRTLLVSIVPTTRSARSSKSRTSVGSCASTVSCRTPKRPGRRAKSRQTWVALAWTCSQWPGTR